MTQLTRDSISIMLQVNEGDELSNQYGFQVVTDALDLCENYKAFVAAQLANQ